MIGQQVVAGLLPWLLALAGIAAAGMYLRWAVIPVRAAYGIGKQIERIRQRR